MSIYGQDPDTGLPRRKPDPDPVTDEQVTAQREKSARARYNRMDVRRLLKQNDPAWSAVLETAAAELTGAIS